jgi:lysyl endopeptidase
MKGGGPVAGRIVARGGASFGTSVFSVVIDPRWGLVGLALLVGWGAAGAARAQHAPPLPSAAYPSVQDTPVPVQQLPAVDGAALRAADRAQDAGVAPHRYGRVVALGVSAARHGAWERLPSGAWLWRVRVRSGGARSLSLALEPFRGPPGTRLYVHGAEGHGAEGHTVRGPYTPSDTTRGQLWTPAVRGEAVTVELVVPDGGRSGVALTLRSAAHGYRALRPSAGGGGLAKAGTCNRDVACDEADPWRRSLRATGLYSYVKNGYSYTCTGTLLNNTARDGRPFFLTAEHCVSTPDQVASMTFYWNYQNATCRAPGSVENGTVTDDDQLDQTSTGALLRARYGSTHETGTIAGKPDLTLVEVDDTIPPRYDLFFAGWSRAGQTTAEAATVHHPDGHGKRISLDRQATALADYGDGPGSGQTHLRVGDWEVGTTERGSSGAPLYDRRRHVVGVLSGGAAGCITGTAEDNDQPDWYGRVAPGFSSGDYTPPGFSRPATLADWLDPAGTGVAALDGRPQQPQPPMGAPTGLAATPAAANVQLDWALPDSVEATAVRVYRARAPIDSTIVTRSVRRPLGRVAAGTTTFVDSTALPDTTYHYRVAAVDSAAYEGPFSGGAQATVTAPGVALADGRDGRPYDPPAPEPGTDRNPVGRFVLRPDAPGARLTGVTVEADGGTAAGIAAAALWRSDDPTFEAGADERLARDDTPSSIAFDGLDAALPAESTYVFLTLDLTTQAGGDYAPLLGSDAALSLADGAIATVNGTPTRTFADAYLSAAPTPLPVELVSFEGTAAEGAVTLTWRTAAETDNARFRIQRRPASAAGGAGTQPAAWTTVGTRAGAGTTTEPRTYRFVDDALPFAADTLAYRLRQVDTDGTVHDSRPITVARGVDALSLAAFPSPARRRLTVRYAVPARQPVRLQLFDVLGRRVRTVVRGARAGRHEATVDLRGLASGLYVLRLRAPAGVRTRKVTVLR